MGERLVTKDNKILGETVNEVEDLIQRLHNHDYEVVTRNEMERNAAYELGEQLQIYDKYRYEGATRKAQAIRVKGAFDKAFATGIVKTGIGIVRKYKECQDGSTKLKDENQKLNEDVQKLNEDVQKWRDKARTCKDKYDELDKIFNYVQGQGL